MAAAHCIHCVHCTHAIVGSHLSDSKDLVLASESCVYVGFVEIFLSALDTICKFRKSAGASWKITTVVVSPAIREHDIFLSYIGSFHRQQHRQARQLPAVGVARDGRRTLGPQNGCPCQLDGLQGSHWQESKCWSSSFRAFVWRRGIVHLVWIVYSRKAGWACCRYDR